VTTSEGVNTAMSNDAEKNERKGFMKVFEKSESFCMRVEGQKDSECWPMGSAESRRWEMVN